MLALLEKLPGQENNIVVMPYNISTWYNIELINIDWANKTYDLYINDSLKSSNIEFYDTDIQYIEELRLGNEWESNSYWDEVIIY